MKKNNNNLPPDIYQTCLYYHVFIPLLVTVVLNLKFKSQLPIVLKK